MMDMIAMMADRHDKMQILDSGPANLESGSYCILSPPPKIGLILESLSWLKSNRELYFVLIVYERGLIRIG